MTEYAIEVNDIYLSYCSQNGISIKDIFRKNRSRKNEFQALKGISFSLEKGRILGIIGKNGSGKSTLLRAIGGIFSADKGCINLFDNKVSLLSIGVGFEYLLTGRENILLSGLLTGFSKKEIDSKINDIIEFSELEEFIDRPVYTYSSGMYSKLAFALATGFQTDILLIDEVLSVGDEKFARKSYDHMKGLIEDREHTVVIVSHDLQTLEELCDEILWIHEGALKMLGEPKEVLEQYKQFMQ